MTHVALSEFLERRPAVVIDGSHVYPISGVYGFGRGLIYRPSIRGDETKYSTLTPLSSGDVVYSKVKAFEGAITVVPPEADGRFVSPEFPVFAVDDAVDPAYLRHALAWDGFQGQLRATSNGVGARRERVNPSTFVKLTVPLPGLPEQQRIAAHLDHLERVAADLSLRIHHHDQLIAMEQLPRLITGALARFDLPAVPIHELADVVHETIHPGMDVTWAEAFVGLEHVESHTGRGLGSRVIGDETGRKFRFDVGDITFGYLRPYLNKVWVADRQGLCSVEQFVLRPTHGTDAALLAHVLRSSVVLDATASATNRLQLPRVKLGTLLAISLPDIRRAPVGLASTLDRVRDGFVSMASVRHQRRSLIGGMLPSARNEVFSAMR